MISEIYATLMIFSTAATGCLSVYFANKSNKSNNSENNKLHPEN